MTVFGGYAQGTGLPTNAVWTLSHANGDGGTPIWKNIVPEGKPGTPPAKRQFHTAVYDPGSNRMTIFGGNQNTATAVFNNTWVLSQREWLGWNAKMAVDRSGRALPAARDSLTAVYDATNNRMMIFGGSGMESLFWSAWVLTDANGR